MLSLICSGLSPVYLCDRELVAGLELFAVPDLAAFLRELDDAVERLHRRVREVGKLERRLQGLGRALDRLRGIALAASGFGGGGGELLVFGHHVRRRALEAGGVVPFDLERVASFLRRPERGGNDGHAVGDFHHVAHAGNAVHAGGIEAIHFLAEARRMRDDRGQHVGQLHVLREARGAVGLRLRIRARHMLADEHEVLRVLDLDRCGHRLFPRRFGELAERRFLAAGVGDDAVFHLHGFRGHLPLLRGGGDQHRARGGARLPILVERIRDGRRAAGALRRPPHEVVVAARIGGRALDPHLRPRGIEFLGDQRRQAGVHALPHLEVLDDDGHRVVAADAQEGIRFERARRGVADGLAGARRLRQCIAEIEAERKTGACRRRRLEEYAPRHRGVRVRVARTHAHRIHRRLLYPRVFAASLIAARMRTYVAQRQALPAMAWSISASVGRFFFVSSAAAAMTCPDWQ